MIFWGHFNLLFDPFLFRFFQEAFISKCTSTAKETWCKFRISFFFCSRSILYFGCWVTNCFCLFFWFSARESPEGVGFGRDAWAWFPLAVWQAWLSTSLQVSKVTKLQCWFPFDLGRLWLQADGNTIVSNFYSLKCVHHGTEHQFSTANWCSHSTSGWFAFRWLSRIRFMFSLFAVLTEHHVVMVMNAWLFCFDCTLCRYGDLMRYWCIWFFEVSEHS